MMHASLVLRLADACLSRKRTPPNDFVLCPMSFSSKNRYHFEKMLTIAFKFFKIVIFQAVYNKIVVCRFVQLIQLDFHKMSIFI